MALEKVYDFFHNYDKQTYQVVACMGNEPSEHDIKKFEHQYGINPVSYTHLSTASPAESCCTPKKPISVKLHR